MENSLVYYVLKCKKENPAGKSIIYLAEMEYEKALELRKKHAREFKKKNFKELRRIENLLGVPYHFSVYWYVDSKEYVHEKFSVDEKIKKVVKKMTRYAPSRKWVPTERLRKSEAKK